MNLLKTFTTGIVALGTFTGAALAQDGMNETMDLEALKAKCQELSSNQQLKPFSAIVTCREVSTEWREAEMDEPETIEISNAREIGASFRLKGFEVPYDGEVVAVEPTLAKCAVLEEYKLTISAVDIELSCEALQEVQSLAQLCSPAIEDRLSEDPNVLREEKTGRTFNSCVGLTSDTPTDDESGEPEETEEES